MYNSTDPNFPTSNSSASFLERIFNPGSGLEFKNDYLRLTKTLTYSYLFALPLVILYEIGIFIVNAGSPFGVRISADVMLKRVLGFIGLDNTLWFAALLILFGIGVVLYERRHNLQMIPRYFAFMFAGKCAVCGCDWHGSRNFCWRHFRNVSSS